MSNFLLGDHYNAFKLGFLTWTNTFGSSVMDIFSFVRELKGSTGGGDLATMYSAVWYLTMPALAAGIVVANFLNTDHAGWKNYNN